MDPTLLIGDVVERDRSGNKSAEFTDTPSSSTGFPQPRKRWKTSAFKQQRAGNTDGAPWKPNNDDSKKSTNDTAQTEATFEEVERRRIDQENRQRIESMSPAEIEQAQSDLMTGMNPDLIRRLLSRATIDEPDPNSPFDSHPQEDQNKPSEPLPEIKVEGPSDPKPATKSRISPEKSHQENEELPKSGNKPTTYDEDKEPTQPLPLFPITDQPQTTHFPAPRSLPDLNPEDPNFLETLHSKYFPDLPSDPSKMAWMAPVPSTDSAADKDSPYYPHPEIAVSALRFDFRGRFLSPRVSRSISSTVGLHHHGEAPEAAGYTITELARLARSAVPAQRCISFQTLGRILYRLGKGDWGKTVDDPIAMGIWTAVKKGRVLETLMEAAAATGGHRGSQSYATEALWLFEKGGWREQFEGR